MRVPAALLVLAMASPASAEETHTSYPWPDTVWSLESDDAFIARTGQSYYRPSEQRFGFYLHGREGEDANFGTAPSSIQEGCERALESTDENEVVRFREDWTGSPWEIEYWYYEADGEGVMLVRQTVVTDFDGCKPRTVTEYLTLRAISQGDRRLILQRGEDDSYRMAPPSFAANTLGRLLSREKRVDQSRAVSKLGNVKTHCVSWSSPPDAGGQRCWVGSLGPARGVVTYELEFIAGGPYYGLRPDDLQNKVWIDGRLFEWERRIEPVVAAPASEPSVPEPVQLWVGPAAEACQFGFSETGPWQPQPPKLPATDNQQSVSIRAVDGAPWKCVAGLIYTQQQSGVAVGFISNPEEP